MAALDPGQPTEQVDATPWTADLDALDVDYLEEELPGRPLRKRIGPFTVVLASLALAAAAFFGGVQLEKRNVKSSSTSGAAAATAAIARFRSAAGGANAAGGGTPAAGGLQTVSGTITLVDGSSVYVTQSDGSIVKVVTGPSSQFTVTSAGTIANLHPGDDVNITGATDANGDVAATAVSDTGAGGATGGAGGRRRGAGGGAGAGTGTGAPGGGAAAPAAPGG